MTQETLSQQPYLLRAMHEWITDSGHTPYLIVDANVAGVQVPEEYVQDGKITLNASYSAVRGLELGNELVSFEARFAGTPFRVSLPMLSVRGIYARESGAGMIFSADEQDEAAGDIGLGQDEDEPRRGRAHLKVIK